MATPTRVKLAGGRRLFRATSARIQGIRCHPVANPTLLLEILGERNGYRIEPENSAHLTAAVEWLRRAQDATADDGFARGYSIAWHPYFRQRGWQPSYPETTGYIIPTFHMLAAAGGHADLTARAIRAADWEIDIQLPDGAVRGGVMGQPVSPSVFNTGQVIFGWLSAFEQTGDSRFAEAAHRAGVFLSGTLESDGHWRQGNSKFARADATLYNARTAWALAEAGVRLDVSEFRTAAERNLRNVANIQHENGWFPYCCLTDSERPLLHTLAYTVRGLLEGGRVLEDAHLIRSASLAAERLAQSVDSRGWMPGRYAADWSPAVRWSCLTGQAQAANIWLRLFAITGEQQWLEPVKPVLRYLKSTQNRSSRNSGVRGGIRGSFPISGDYGRYEVLNWATKFFADALFRDDLASTGLEALRAGDHPLA